MLMFYKKTFTILLIYPCIFTLEFTFAYEWITKELKLPEHRRIKCIMEDVYIFRLGLADQQYSILIVLAE